jgi:hypothetical protein
MGFEDPTHHFADIIEDNFTRIIIVNQLFNFSCIVQQHNISRCIQSIQISLPPALESVFKVFAGSRLPFPDLQSAVPAIRLFFAGLTALFDVSAFFVRTDKAAAFFQHHTAAARAFLF